MTITDEEYGKVLAALKTVDDPEIGMDIVSLGLVYKVEPAGDNGILLEMTLTTPGCPVSEILPRMAQEAAEQALGPDHPIPVDLRVVWDPPWGPELIDPEALAKLQGG